MAIKLVLGGQTINSVLEPQVTQCYRIDRIFSNQGNQVIRALM